MRIKIVLKACDKLTLPRAYQALVREFLLNTASYNRDYQKLNFSNLKGDFESTPDKQLVFTDTITLYVTSPDDAFINALYKGLDNELVLNNQNVVLEDKQTSTFTVKFSDYSLKTLSAATVYELVGKKPKYYNPNDEKYFEIINKNIKNVLKNPELEDVVFSNVEKVKKIITVFNSTIIEGYIFDCRISGPKEAITFLYNNGMGNRTFQGFGMCMLGK